MRKAIALIMTLALTLVCAGALADDYGKAVIDGRSGYKVHLRAEPSANSQSLGLYFTGTSATLKSDPDGEWVEVKIGRERGYMKSKYLKTGAAAESVAPRFWEGTIQANKYARMRKGPSTEYQFIRNVNDGENVTIMGETDENWYYVEYKGDKGFISANLIYTRGSVSSQAGVAEEETAAPVYVPSSGWRAAYRTYLMQQADSSDTFALIYVNDDDVPELVIDSGVEAAGCRILTYGAGGVNVLTTRRRGFSYIERVNRLLNSDGVMDSYYDDVYEIRNGRWVCIARGEYYGYLSGWNEIIGRYVCQNYVWNGEKTDIGQYMISLGNVFEARYAVSVEDGCSLGSMLNMLTEVTY